ncbi:MAG: M24 family metallopeptidase [Phycisphaerales bacterium]|nr:M24 family metallopeptidase [Phycisphaerales bacterium]
MKGQLSIGIEPIKRDRLNALCERLGLHALLLRKRANIAWLTDGADVHVDLGSATGVGSVLWFAESFKRKPVLLTDNIERNRLLKEEQFDPEHWDVVAPNWWSYEAAFDSMLDSAFKKAGADISRCGFDVIGADPVQSIRTPLTEREIATVRALGADAAQVMAETLTHFIKPGVSELEIAGHLTGELGSLNILAPVVLIAADDRLQRYRHPIPTSNRIEKTVMVALCAQRKGLTVSISRLVHFGRSLPDDLKRRHEAVCKVDRALHDATQVGRRWCDCLADGIAMYEQCGFKDEWHKHHQGGPMGYDLRDFKATPDETRTVQPRQLVGWNPSITGTKSEDTILTPNANMPGESCENLTAMRNWPLDESTGRPAILVVNG